MEQIVLGQKFRASRAQAPCIVSEKTEPDLWARAQARPTSRANGWEDFTFSQGILKGEVSNCTVDLLLDWFGISCMTTDNFFLCAKQANPNQ